MEKAQRLLVTEKPTQDTGENILMEGLDGNLYRVFAALPTEKEEPQEGWRIAHAIRIQRS